MLSDITIGPITLHMYGLMIAVGFLAALWLCLRRSQKMGLDPERIWGIFYCAVIGGLLGARLLFYIVEIPDILQNPSILWDFRNGYVVYGGIIGGIVTAWVYCRVKKIPFLEYFDLVMPAVSLAQGFGRIGCLCAGCCYGRETDSVFGIVFQHSHYAPNGVSLIPTQIISSVLDFLLCALLIWLASKKPATGRVASAWMVFYGVGRFLLEFLRNDYRGSIGIFSTSQLISIGVSILGVILWCTVPKLKKDGEKT